ncbi:hypothetical protein BANRA_04137 [Klebsiella quasipneumoniae]|nr:hypothetical protein BANRA_04137 [Klebsiella quasipneumoniae]
MDFFIQPEENQPLLFGLLLNIKTQLSGCCLYPLASINISRQLFPAVMLPYPCGGLRPRHFSLVLASTGRVLFNLRSFYIHFIA